MERRGPTVVGPGPRPKGAVTRPLTRLASNKIGSGRSLVNSYPDG
ncbi:hypothetical protein STRTUCAR8_09631 [Streptomyces turgidiscabies Car8]|uniref:Uncharacterized protein n=1 Tax=Streptomyces turgidiscabies (strain Car8) TaxID=698760 RepID=L7EPP7_STRT8|nr:hypothetical protein STRTUCAR8_09631 [Streptomyces turgidiscabies Car8]